MKLSAQILKNISPGKVIIPDKKILGLPEKIIQFGTGILLRGLPDYFVDKANRLGIFNGRIVVVKSTAKGDAGLFAQQDNLYTLCVRGIDDGKQIKENIINSSISRVLVADTHWEKVLACAHNESLAVILSNTTEAGIQLVNEHIDLKPPHSYPGKLFAFLYERFTAFGGSEKSGFVIIPTELIPGNGQKLKSILTELAQFNELGEAFTGWLTRCNHFCNSLVDRIVTGMPDEKTKKEIEQELGYTDELMNVCEVYKLWTIEGDEHIKKILSFAEADEGMIIAPNIDLYRELKLRLLNGTHTLNCGIAFLAGITTVKEAMENEVMKSYITSLMQKEIGPSIPYEIDTKILQDFMVKVLDRFRNPYLDHQWKNITLNYSYKIKIRCLPLLNRYYELYKRPPELMSLGFAAYIYFMKAIEKSGKNYYGFHNEDKYLLEDNMAGKFFEAWKNPDAGEVVKTILKDTELWEQDLTELTGFQQDVTDKLQSIISEGMIAPIENVHLNKMHK